MAYGSGYAGGYADITVQVVLTVEAELDPVGDPDEWTDLSADARTLSTNRGKQLELDRFRTGRATVVLENSDRAYDPAVDPDFKPNRRVRATAQYDGVTYPLFAGYIDRVIQDYTGPHTATAQVEASDAFKRLNRAELPSGAYAAEVLADGPTRWYRLNEPDDSLVLFDEVGTADLDLDGGPEMSVQGLLSRDPDTAMQITGAGQGAILTAAGAALTGFTVEMLFRSESTDDGSFVAETNDIGTLGYLLRADGDPDVLNAIVATTAGNVALTSAIQVDDDVAHHFALTWDGATIRLYADGVQVDSDSLAGSMPAMTSRVTVIGGYSIGPNTVTGVFGTYDEVAFYDEALSAGRILAHYEAMATPWDGDTPAERIDRILDVVDFDPALRDLDTGTSTLQPATLGQTALEHIQKVADSDFGVVFVTADGLVRFRGRDGLANPVSEATFTDAHGSGPAISMLAPEITDDLVRNDARISRLDGKLQRAIDAGSIAEHGTVTFTRDGLFHDSDTLSLNAAEWVVAEWSEPLQRINRVVIRPRGDPATLFPLVLGLELADAVLIEHTPQGDGTEISQLSVIEGIEHDVGPKHWETRLNVSPAFGGTVGYWELGVAGHSELGETTRLFF